MGQATTTKAINTAQVQSLVGQRALTVIANDSTSTTETKTIEVAGWTDQQVASVLSTYTFDPEFGKTDEQKDHELSVAQLPAVRAKLRDVLAGNSGFTNAQRDQAIAYICLKLSGR